jgi:hypothetical protein
MKTRDERGDRDRHTESSRNRDRHTKSSKTDTYVTKTVTERASVIRNTTETKAGNTCKCVAQAETFPTHRQKAGTGTGTTRDVET